MCSAVMLVVLVYMSTDRQCCSFVIVCHVHGCYSQTSQLSSCNTAKPRIPTLLSILPPSPVVGRSRCVNCDTANAVTVHVLTTALYKPDRQVPCLSSLAPSRARTYTRLSTHIHWQTRRSSTCLSSQPCASLCLAKSAVSMCLRGCRGTGRAPLGRTDC